jgi:hypothetical protein
MTIRRVLIASAVAALSAQASAAAFNANDVVVYRVGSGAAALSSASTAVFLDEYSSAGSFVQSVAMPTVASGVINALTASGSATSEGLINRSADGSTLLVPGYAITTGSGAVASSTAATAPREAAVVGSNGTVQSTVTAGTLFGANNMRSAASVTGTGAYIGAANGVAYVSGSGTVNQLNSTNTRDLVIADNQLFYSTGSGTTTGIYALGAGLPTSGSLTGTLIAASASPYAFFFADLSSSVAGVDTLYVADDTASTGGIRKFSKSASGTWTLKSTLSITAVRGLTGIVSGDQVQLFATSASTLYGVTDTAGYDANLGGSAITLATAGANTAFRGLALAPQAITPSVPEPASYGLALVSLMLIGAAAKRRG